MADDSNQRLHALDAIRGYALIAGVVFHAIMSFLPSPRGVPIWVVMDTDRSLVLAGVFHVIHIFRMSLFFLIAGFFARMLVQRRGPKGFLRDRLVRIGVPFLTGWPLFFAIAAGLEIWAAVAITDGRSMQPAATPAFKLTHLWFLWVLLLLYGAALAIRTVILAVDRSGALRRGVDKAARLLVESPLGFLALAAPIAVAFYCTRAWLPWWGIPTPDSSLVPGPAAALAYFIAFALGWLLRRQSGLLETWRRRWKLNLALAAGFTVAELSITGLAPAIVPPGQGWSKLASAALYAMAIWTWTPAMIGAALQFLSQASPARRYIADASYWIYLVHMPLVLALQIVFARLSWPWFVELPLLLALAFAPMFASYQLFVRHGWLGVVLNGKRMPRTQAQGQGEPAFAGLSRATT